jgi:hypothetical protein
MCMYLSVPGARALYQDACSCFERFVAPSPSLHMYVLDRPEHKHSQAHNQAFDQQSSQPSGGAQTSYPTRSEPVFLAYTIACAPHQSKCARA